MQNPDQPSPQLQPQQPPAGAGPPQYRYWPVLSHQPESTLKDLPLFGDKYINHPRRFLGFQAVKDAFYILNLNLDHIYELRRTFHGNVTISSLPFKPLSEKSDIWLLENVVVGVLEAILREVRVEEATVGISLKEVLDRVGVPKSHQNSVVQSLTQPDLSYWLFLIVMSIYFELPPPSKVELFPCNV